MKTSTAFAILAVLAAGTNAIPISRREEDCACELLDPNNTVDDVHTIHKDGSDLLPASQSGGSNPLIDIGASLLSHGGQSSPSSTQGGNGVDNITNPVLDGAAPITEDDGTFINDGTPLLLSRPTEAEPTTGDDTFGNIDDAFRPTRPVSASSTNETPAEGDMSQEDGALQAIDGNEPITGGDGDLEGLGEPIGDNLDNITKPSTNDNGDGLDNLLQSGEAVNDALSDPSTLSNQPVGQTVDDISPGTGTQATDAANGPLSNAADSVVPGTGDAVNGPISNVADGVAPGNGDKANEALASPVSDSAETILPGSGSTVDDAANGPATTVVDPILPGTSSTVSDAANGPTSSVADPILPDTGAELTEATSSTADEVVDGVVPGTGPTVQDAANSPAQDTAETVLPGTGPVVNDAVNQPVSQTLENHLSGDHLGDHLDGHHLEQLGDHSDHLQSLDQILSPQQGQSNSSPLTDKVGSAGQLLAASLGSGLLSGGDPLGGLSGSTTPLLSGGGLGSIIPSVSGGGLSINLSGAVGLSSPSTGGDPSSISGPLDSVLSGPGGSPLTGLSSGLPIGSGPLSGGSSNPLTDITDPVTSSGSSDSPINAVTSGGLPLLSGAIPSSSSGSPLGSLTDSLSPSQGSPIIPGSNDPVGDILSPSSGDPITDSPLINTLSLPESDDEFFGAGNQLFGKTKAGPLASDVENDVNNDCINDCVEAITEPTTSRVNTAEELIKSDPLALKPFASETAAPIVCATAPITSMPAFTFPCLTNFDGSVGTMVDMCIASSMVDSRPASTFVCPEDMQDFTPDDLNLFRRGHHDEKWDLLGRTVGSFVRLCITSNNL